MVIHELIFGQKIIFGPFFVQQNAPPTYFLFQDEQITIVPPHRGWGGGRCSEGRCIRPAADVIQTNHLDVCFNFLLRNFKDFLALSGIQTLYIRKTQSLHKRTLTYFVSFKFHCFTCLDSAALNMLN